MNLFRKKINWRKKILFISSPITTKLKGTETLDYFAYIIAMLSHYINTDNQLKEYDLVIKVPNDTEPLTMQRNIIIDTIEVLKTNAKEYSAVIISPYDKNKLKGKIAELCKKTKVLLIDQGFMEEDYEYFNDNNIPLPPYVQSDWEDAGKKAAHSILKYFNEKKIDKPKILIVRGHVGSDERINGFKTVFNNSVIRPNYLGVINGDYSRQKAIEVFNEYLDRTNNKQIDAIYCTNDAMALGIKVVLREKKYKNTNNTYPKIIGHDGIRDITISIDSNDDYIYDTIDVGIINQVEILVKKILIKHINNLPMQDIDKYVSVTNKSYKYGNNI